MQNHEKNTLSPEIVEFIQENEMPELDLIAQSVLKTQAKTPNISLIELCAELNRGIYSIKKALRYYELVVNAKGELPIAMGIEDVKAKCREALITSFRKQIPFTIQNMIVQMDFSILETRAVWDFYANLQTELPPPDQTLRFNDASRLLAIYMYKKHLTQPPSIAEILSELDFTFDVAARIVPFINFWIKKSCIASKTSFSEDRAKKLDAFAILVANRLKQDGESQFDYLKFMGELSLGIVDLKETIAYYQWILGEADVSLPTDRETLEKLDLSTKEVIVQVNPQKSLNVEMLTELGYSLAHAKQILAYYQKVIAEQVDFSTLDLDQVKKYDQIAREVYQFHEDGALEVYDLNQVLKVVSCGLRDAWYGLNFLRQKVMPGLASAAPMVQQSMASLTLDTRTAGVLNDLKQETIPESETKIELRTEKINLNTFEVNVETSTDQVEVTRGFDFEGGLIRFKVVVKNNTGLSIANVEVSLRRAEHVRLIRIAPKSYANVEAEKAVIPNMSHRQSQSFDFYLEPLICGSVPIETMVIYQDATGKSRSIIKEPKMVQTKCPPVVPVEEANLANVEHLFKETLKAQQRRSFECREDPKRIFLYLQEAIQTWAGPPISEPLKLKGPFFKATAYFFVQSTVPPKNEAGTSKKAKKEFEQIILRVSVNEEAGTAALEVAAGTVETASGVMTHVWSLCQRRLVETLSCELKTLWCPECGASLEVIPQEGAPVKCKHCDQWIHAIIK